jgi:hypothetical protein
MRDSGGGFFSAEDADSPSPTQVIIIVPVLAILVSSSRTDGWSHPIIIGQINRSTADPPFRSLERTHTGRGQPGRRLLRVDVR